MLKLNSHTILEDPGRIRLLDYTIGLFPQLPSRNSVKKVIKRAELLHNGKRAEQGSWLQKGDCIELIDLETKPPKPYEMDLEVVWEDDHLAVINKPAGIVVSGNQFRTIENALQDNLKPSCAEDALKWAKPVHRLDHPTSGLLIVAKTSSAHMALGHQFEERTVQKTYRAIVKGTPEAQGRIEQKIEAQEAVSEYRLLKSSKSLKNGTLSLLELKPLTGRTHQLRIHLAGIGHPIIGDKIHDDKEKTISHKGLFLASVGLRFLHPISNEPIQVSIDEPTKFGSLLEREERRWLKFKNEHTIEN